MTAAVSGLRAGAGTRRWPWATLLVFGLCGLIHLAELVYPSGWDTVWFLAPEHARLWDAVTYAFFHRETLHFVSNMVFLWLVGPRVERAVGAGTMLCFFLLGAVVAGLLHVSMVYLFANGSAAQPLMGASGGIASLLGVYTVRFHGRKIGMLPVSVAWLLGAWVLSEGVFGWRGIAGGQDHVSHWAHVGGFLAGWTLAVMSGQHRTARREAALEAAPPQQQTQRLAAYLRDHPHDAASRREYAGLLARQGERERAARHFSRALETYLTHGQAKESAETYLVMRGIGLQPSSDALEARAAKAMAESDMPREALAVYDRLSSTPGPEAENASLRAAQLAEKLSLPAEARDRYRAFLLMFPDSQWADRARERIVKLSETV